MGNAPIDEFGPASGRHEEYFALPRIIDSHPDGPADGRLVHKRPANWHVMSMVCRRRGRWRDEVAGRSLFQQPRRPTCRIAEVLASDRNATKAPTMVFDEQQPLLQRTDHYLKVLDEQSWMHCHLSESNIEL
jgi:hypothetical protein